MIDISKMPKVQQIELAKALLQEINKLDTDAVESIILSINDKGFNKDQEIEILEEKISDLEEELEDYVCDLDNAQETINDLEYNLQNAQEELNEYKAREEIDD